LYLYDLNGAASVVGREELGMLEAETVHVDNDGEAGYLCFRFLNDVLQC
jgi:hypothetical protein